MQKIIAAFLWDTNNKTISFMIIDQQFKLLQRPRQYHLNFLELKKFSEKAEKIIKNFYHEIHALYQKHLPTRVQIEYKIVHQVKAEVSDLYQASPESEFVRRKFYENYALMKAKILPMRLAKQLRARLKRPPLDIFKKTMRELALVPSKRNNHYQYHLWILATHATKSNYKKILQRIKQANFSPIPSTLH